MVIDYPPSKQEKKLHLPLIWPIYSRHQNAGPGTFLYPCLVPAGCWVNGWEDGFSPFGWRQPSKPGGMCRDQFPFSTKFPPFTIWYSCEWNAHRPPASPLTLLTIAVRRAVHLQRKFSVHSTSNSTSILSNTSTFPEQMWRELVCWASVIPKSNCWEGLSKQILTHAQGYCRNHEKNISACCGAVLHSFALFKIWCTSVLHSYALFRIWGTSVFHSYILFEIQCTSVLH